MLHRINIDLSFVDPAFALALYNHAAGVIGNAVTIKPGTLQQERGHIVLQDCGHDETPQTPCIVIEEESTPAGQD